MASLRSGPHLDVLLSQPVQRVQQFGVLEVVGGQQKDLALCGNHEIDHTRAPADALRPPPRRGRNRPAGHNIRLSGV